MNSLEVHFSVKVGTMITQKQQVWVDHLCDTDSVQIIPYDPETPNKFAQLKSQIMDLFDSAYEIILRGASGMRISGQGELDVYIPVSPETFDKAVGDIQKLFGEPRSYYPLERARFVTYIDSTEATVFVINDQDEGWLNSLKFENYLLTHPEYLERYRILKENGVGLSTRAYYRRKIEFFNEILNLVG